MEKGQNVLSPDTHQPQVKKQLCGIIRKRTFFAICAGCTFAYLFILNITANNGNTEMLDAPRVLKDNSLKVYDEDVPDHASMKKSCHIPDVDPWEESVKPFVLRPSPFSCPPPPPMSYLATCSTPEIKNLTSRGDFESTTRIEATEDPMSSTCQRPSDWPPSLQPPPLLTLNLTHKDWSDDLECCAAELIRGEPRSGNDLDTDFRFSVGECKPFYQATTLTSEFTVVNCTRGQREVYSDIHSYAMPSKATLEKMAKASGGPIPTSIMLVGIDSSSRLNFFRAMPKTRAVLEKLGAVGDNTFPNLLAILAGTSEDDATGRNKKSTKPKGYRCWPSTGSVLDDCPYLFKNFSQSGYVTLFTEDQPDLGAFTYEKKGFRHQPTDHFSRPYYLFAQARLHVIKFKLDWCYSNKETHIRTMEYILSFLSTYHSKVPFFAFVYFTGMSHNSPQDIELVDNDMADFMQHIIDVADSGMEKHGVGLFLAMLSDHGARFGKLRESPLGWLEERLPFLFIRPPIKFNGTRDSSTNYPLLVKSQYPTLVVNRNRLTSPFDMHFTLSAYLPGGVAPCSSCSKCYDLLHEEVPLERTCSDAAIPNKWCACAESTEVAVDDPHVTDASTAAIDYINKMFADYPQCANLTIETMVAARHLIISTQVKNHMGKLKLLELTFVTVPGKAKFEVNTLENEKGEFKVQSNPSRLNSYGNQSSCVHDAKMRLYCFCSGR